MTASASKHHIILCTSLFLSLLWHSSFAQKYNFQHYDIDKGLLQSQVTAIRKDRLNQIWATSLGGVNCFDGKQFTAFTSGDSAGSYDNYAVTPDNTDRIWCGNSTGVTCFDSRGAVYYPFAQTSYTRPVKQLICDNQNKIWALAGGHLFRVHKGKLELQIVTGPQEMISYLERDEFGNVYASVYLKGIYVAHNQTWKPFAVTDQVQQIGYIREFAFLPGNSGVIYMTCKAGLFCWKDSQVIQVEKKLLANVISSVMDISIDHNQGIWLGADKGAYLLSNHTLKHFDAANGFTDSRVFCTYVDDDNQVWFGTDGAGLFKYRPNDYLVYDKSQGLSSELIMGIAKTRSDIYFGFYGDGVKKLVNNNIVDVKGLPLSLTNGTRINCLFVDSNNDLWIGTDVAGLWKKTKSGTRKISPVYYCTSINEDKEHVIWVTTNAGLFYIKNGKTMAVPGVNFQCSATLAMGDDQMLVGTHSGALLVKNKKIAEKSIMFRGINIPSLQRYGASIIIGTMGRGVYIWNTKLNTFQNLTVQDQLSSNMIYSILAVDKQLWIGTARGIDRFTIADGNSLTLKSKPVTPDIYECNQNAILYYNGKVWVGTSHGILVFDTQHTSSQSYSLHLALQKVIINNPRVKYISVFKNGYTVPVKPELPSDKSRITLKFHTVEFANNASALYQYKLEGLDKDFSSPVQNDVVEYPQLPPGSYTFKARAILDSSVSNTISYEFTVTPTIYQTLYFRIIVVVVCISMIFGLYRYKIYNHRRELNYINQLKHHEQDLVRRQTAADFHDDFGNKLTRINMLSEILAKNIPQHNETERKIILQIQQSASEMYAGTKDILWALNPDNDNLAEVLFAIESFAENLFSGTDIAVNFNIHEKEADFDRIILPLGHSRNIILIFKELFTNILKHSKANIVTFTAEITSIGYISIKVADNGNGFDASQAFNGNGIRNMKNRAAKLNATLSINSEEKPGTTSTLLIPVP